MWFLIRRFAPANLVLYATINLTIDSPVAMSGSRRAQQRLWPENGNEAVRLGGGGLSANRDSNQPSVGWKPILATKSSRITASVTG